MGEMSTFPTPDVLTQQQSSASTSTGQRNDELPEVQSQEGVQTSAPPASSPEETLRGAGVNEERISWAEETDTETEDEACSPAGGGTPYLLAAPRLLKSNARRPSVDSVSSDASSPHVSMANLALEDPSLRPRSQWQLNHIRDGLSSDRGGREYMEDRQVAVVDLKDFLSKEQLVGIPQTTAFFAVFDGHGGESASEFAAEHLLQQVISDERFPQDTNQALAAGFLETDRLYEIAWEGGKVEGSGTTALVALIWGREITVANLGDCRAVVSRRGKAVDLSRDQKPSSDSEQKRIIAAGGHVCPEGFLNGVLGVSRAIGNWHMRCRDDCLLKRRVAAEPGEAKCLHATAGPLISVPEICTYRITPDDEFMVLATDGLWDVYSSQRCIEVARMLLQEDNDPQACAEGLVQRALEMHTTDNVSVQVICFGSDPPPMRRPSPFNRNLSVEGLSKLRTALGETLTSPMSSFSFALPSRIPPSSVPPSSMSNGGTQSSQ